MIIVLQVILALAIAGGVYTVGLRRGARRARLRERERCSRVVCMALIRLHIENLPEQLRSDLMVMVGEINLDFALATTNKAYLEQQRASSAGSVKEASSGGASGSGPAPGPAEAE